jgi:hypothetical protein
MVRSRSLALLCALVALVATAPSAYAAAPQRDGISVEPSTTIHAAKPGATFVVRLRITNSTDATVHVDTKAVQAAGSSDPESLLQLDAHPSKDRTRNAATWLTFPTGVIVLAPGENANVPITLRVPADARPGVHGALAIFSVPTTRAGASGAGVSGKAGLGAALLLEVPGDAQASARILKVSGPTTTRGDANSTFTARVENTGDTLLHLDAEIRLAAPWSATRILRADEQLVLPGGQRRVQLRYEDPPLIGRYEPKLVVVGGAGSGVRITRDLATLWVLPPWWLVLIVVVAAALALAGARARRRSRREQ